MLFEPDTCSCAVSGEMVRGTMAYALLVACERHQTADAAVADNVAKNIALGKVRSAAPDLDYTKITWSFDDGGLRLHFPMLTQGEAEILATNAGLDLAVAVNGKP